MGDTIKQFNIFGDNLFKSLKIKILNIKITKHHVQGFIVGVIISVIGCFIYELIK